MAKQQPSYSKEFKQEAVRLVETSGKGKSAVARDLGISDVRPIKHEQKLEHLSLNI